MSWYGDLGSSFVDWWKGGGKDYGKNVPMPDTSWSRGANRDYERFEDLRAPRLGDASLSRTGGGFRHDQRDLSDMLMRRARGRGLVSGIQADQGAQQAVQAQQAFAASAAPAQRAAANRMMMQNAGNVMSGLAGQRALAGAQESMMAAGQAGGVLQGARGLDLQNQQFNASQMNQRDMDQANLEMMRRQQLLGSLGQQGGMNMGISDLELRRNLGVAGVNAQANAGQPTGWDRAMNLGSTALGVGFLMSDERVKKDVKDGGEEADEFLDTLLARRYRYKDERHGKGKKLGVMAQDLERSRAGRRAVVETREGKAVDFLALAPVFAASLARLNQRVRKVEATR